MSITTEIWKTIPNTFGRYQASNQGNFQRILKDGRTVDKRIIREPVGNSISHVVYIGCLGGCTPGRIIADLFIRPVQRDEVVLRIDTSVEYFGADNLRIMPKQYMATIMNNFHPVVKINRDGAIIEKYKTLADACRKNYMSECAVRARCSHKLKDSTDEYSTLGGYSFRWAEEAAGWIDVDAASPTETAPGYDKISMPIDVLMKDGTIHWNAFATTDGTEKYYKNDMKRLHDEEIKAWRYSTEVSA